MKLLIRGARILDPSQGLDREGDLLVEEGRIAALEGEIPADPQTEIIEARGKWLVPGLIDMHVHLREPGEEWKEDIESGSRAAAAGGFTAVACMPNTRPPNDSPETTRYILDRAREVDLVRVYPVACISRGQEGRELAPFGELREAGAVAVSDDGRPVADAGLMRLALEYARSFDLPVISHAEDPGLSAGGQVNEGIVSARLGLKGIPAEAEEVAVFRDIALAKLTGHPVHIAHVSTAGAVEIIRRAKEEGLPVTAETAPHYFTLTEEAVLDYDTNAKVNPPLRTERDREAVRRALAEGVIDTVATDHAPHSPLEKEVEFPAAAFGLIGLETALPLTLRLVREGLISPLRMVELLSTNPARILKVPGGTLKPGSPADLTLIDPEAVWVVTGETLYSKSKNSPFLGWEMRGRAVLTVVGGRIVWRI
ncbi:dihydroorotase [Thermosulfurimonas sp. F29]|uniref:dihydroorotase n=1 Tax=Thermosulfurimonas sp. F29 TaxID=2867247 RepID=UPI001C82C2BC|nr:dihydroorotase [Thermosulfurimonas sp. F29]MBX6423995.1 dihydroorotase [Thermosulfurimonas sp. F29]